MLRPLSQNLFVQITKNAMKKYQSKSVVKDVVRRLASSESVKAELIEIQDTKDFNERVKNSKVPVIVDFFATWCNPCKIMTPRLETVIAEKKGKVLLAKVDVDENTDLALDYEVASVPVILAMDNGEVVAKLIGLQDEDKLRKFVGKLVREHEEEQERRDMKKANPE